MTPGTLPATPAGWFLEGMKGIVSLPGFILMTAYAGFTALAFQSGLTRGEAAFMTLAVWALPSQLIIVGAVTSGMGVLAAFAAVSLASIRMMPMVAALIPEVKSRKTSSILLLLLSHFVAITAWVYTLKRTDGIPREGRLAFFAGFGVTLTAVNALLVFSLYGVVSSLPPIAAGTLYFLTPMYFVMSIWDSARERVVYWALCAGLVMTPVSHWLAPRFDLLVTGLVAGTAVYAAERSLRKRRQ